MEKKNPFVTTVGFKKDDPDHIYVAELLNSLGSGKAQYIVKAVLFYQEMLKKGEIPQSMGIPYNYEGIKQIVLQVIEERERQSGKLVSILDKTEPEPIQQKDLLQEFDNDALSDIMASIAAFQEQ